MRGYEVGVGDYIPVSNGYFERVASVDPGGAPVTEGERVSAEEYQEIMHQKQLATEKAAEARANRPETKPRTDLTGLGTLAVGKLIKV